MASGHKPVDRRPVRSSTFFRPPVGNGQVSAGYVETLRRLGADQALIDTITGRRKRPRFRLLAG
jgi:hypothetical protein